MNGKDLLRISIHPIPSGCLPRCHEGTKNLSANTRDNCRRLILVVVRFFQRGSQRTKSHMLGGERGQRMLIEGCKESNVQK